MAKTLETKKQLLAKYEQLLSSNSGYILVDISNLSTAAITDLKMKLKEIGSSFSVIKNTILKIALQNANQPVNTQEFTGQTAIISVGEDPSIAAKLVKEAQTATKQLEARSGLFKGEYLSAERVMELAELPSKEVLLAKLLGSFNAPLSGLVTTLTGNVKGLVMVLKGISEKKQ